MDSDSSTPRPYTQMNDYACDARLMSRKQAAAYLGVAPTTLAIWKCTGRYNLPVYKVGRLAKYKKSDLDEFIASGLAS